jgi:DNA-binding NarL/FixJ family response regulator
MSRMLIVHPIRLTGGLLATAVQAEFSFDTVEYTHRTAEALAKSARILFDLAILHCDLPSLGALRLLQSFRQRQPSCKVVMLGVEPSTAAVVQWVEAGVSGYLVAGGAMSTLLCTVQAVMAGEFSVPPAIAGALIARLAELKRQVNMICTRAAGEAVQQPTHLTQREWEILGGIEQGWTNQQIAEALVIEPGTVKNHLHNLMQKLNVTNRQQALAMAQVRLAQEGRAQLRMSQHYSILLIATLGFSVQILLLGC